MFVNVTRTTYTKTRTGDVIMTISFYVICAIIAGISGYLVFIFQSGDMLLIAATTGIVLYERVFPRLWSVSARRFHWETPMWRGKDGVLYKRVRQMDRTERLIEDTERWNGRVYKMELKDGTEARQVKELDGYHWEMHMQQWRDLVVLGRVGVRRARRGAIALRIAYMIPLPAQIWLRKSERFAAKGSAEGEVRKTWGRSVGDVPGVANGDWRKQPGEWVEVNDREDLAMLMHLKLLMFEEKMRKRDKEGDWMELVECWRTADMQTGERELGRTDGLLAQGTLNEERTRFWYFVAESHMHKRFANMGFEEETETQDIQRVVEQEGMKDDGSPQRADGNARDQHAGSEHRQTRRQQQLQRIWRDDVAGPDQV